MYRCISFLALFALCSIDRCHGFSIRTYNISGEQDPFNPDIIEKKELKIESTQLNKKIKSYIDNQIARIRQGIVAFSAYMSNTMADKSDSLTEGSRVVFDQVLTNDKGAYNSVSGGFLPPNTGLYAFTYTLCVDSGFSDQKATGPYRYGEFGTRLMDGSSIIAILHVDTETIFDDDCSSAFVVYDVKSITNEIYVEVSSYAHQGKLLSRKGQTRSTFTGWKLS